MHACLCVCVFAHALRHLGSVASEKHFLWLLRNTAFLWCRLSVTLHWSALERGRANSVSVWSQEFTSGLSLVGINCQWIIPCGKGPFLDIHIQSKGKCATQQQGASLQTALQTIQGRWTLDISAQKEMAAQLFETRSNYWWVWRQKWMWFSMRGNLKNLFKTENRDTKMPPRSHNY